MVQLRERCYASGVLPVDVESSSVTPLSGAGGAQFTTTHWSVVLAAGLQPSPQTDQALEALCRTYWYALYAFVRRQGYDVPDAQDLTQEFFARFLDKKYIQRADPERGRFRSFLLACLKNFLANEWDRARTVKRGAAFKTISWDEHLAENQFIAEPANGASPDEAFEKRWAGMLLEQVLVRLREEFTAAGKSETFNPLKQFLWGAESSISYADLSKQLGLSEGAARVAVHRFRQRYQELLRTAIADTVADPQDVDDELRHLISVIRREAA
jgi:RNA polymerase sigma factor (sigma-70 family)